MEARAQVSRTLKLATFSDLPNELLVKIFCQEDEPKTKRRLLELRWVSRVVDEVIGHRVVEYLRLPKDAQQVEAMLASGPSPFDTATRTLHVQVQHYDPGDSTKWQGLAILIERMKGIQAIRLVIRGPLNERIANALNRLPELDNLEVVVEEEPPGDSLRLPLLILINLKSISLELAYLRNSVQIGGSDIDDDTKGAISYLVSNSPLLEHLSIGPSHIIPLNLESIMATPHWAQTNPLPFLKTIATSNITLSTSPNSVTPFTRLSSLQVPNNLPDTASLWVALRTAGINLQTIKVERLSVPLLDYLSGYRGLRAFQLGGYSSDYGEVTEDDWMDFRVLRQRLLSSGILKHRATFVDLRFCVSRDPSTIRRWESSIFCPSPNIVASMHSFRALERLDVVADTKVGGLHLTMLLTALPALSPKLRTVCFRVIGLGLPRYADGQQYIDTLQSVLEGVEEIRFLIRPVNWKALRVLVRTFDPHRAHIPGIPFGVNCVAYQVKLDASSDKTQWGLAVDPLATELLGEESARFKDEDMII